jgi:hypothetical protein
MSIEICMSRNHRAARIVHLTRNDRVVRTSLHNSMEDDDDDKAGLIDIETVAINNTHNGVGDAAAAPNADELIEAARADNRIAINQYSQCDCVYLQTMRKLQSFVDSQRDLGMLDASPTYFTGQILTCFLRPKSAKRYAQALNWFALRDVHTHGEVPVIGQPAVTEALATQQCCHHAAGAANGAIGRGQSDPHDAHHMDILSEVQYRTAVLAAVQHTDWKTMYVAWTVCEQTMLHMGSLWVLKFCNLRCNLTHGPTCVNWADGC